MQRPLSTAIGAPVEEIDTPALLVDLDRLDANIAALKVPARAAAWVHKTPAIAHRQAQSPHFRGLAVRSLAEAEVFAAAGFTDIRLLRPLVTVAAKRRAEALARTVRLNTAEDADDLPLWAEDALAGAVTVSARVASAPEPGLAIHDCGQKAIGRDFGNPRVKGWPHLKAVGGSAEHGIVQGEDGARLPRIGDWLSLIPADLATVFALHDFAHGVRAGCLEAIWPVSARGAF